MAIKFNAKNILIASIVIACVVGVIVIKIKPLLQPTPTVDLKAVAACQKTVETTYSSLLDTAILVAPGTTKTIQQEEQDAKNTCVSSNTH
jgi:hypothetical protein